MSLRFTERAQRVILLAQEEARRLNHDHVTTELILLALIALDEGMAAQMFAKFSVDLRRMRSILEKVIGTGDNLMLLGEIPFIPDSKKVLECSVEEAQGMGHSNVGTGHLLLGLLRAESTAKILREQGLTLEAARNEVVDGAGEGHPPLPHMPKPITVESLDEQLLAISMAPEVIGILLLPGTSAAPTIILLLKEGTTPASAYMSLASLLPVVDRLRFKEPGKVPVSWSNGKWKEDQEIGATLTF